ncbi:MAG: phosphotransferase, partial [Acidimicrobiales bacterium]|nr:phosphotransferase [Acidimicrobiales bacterium]
GVLDRLPLGIGHALVDSWQDGDEAVLVMRDLGTAVVGWSRTISRAECRRLWAAATAMHRSFSGESPAGLVPLAERVSLFAPSRMRAELASGHRLPAAVLHGWERFAGIVSPDVVAAVMGVLDQPRRLAGPLSRRPSTMIHGDLWLVNVAFEATQITLLDWDLATWAPPALELALFLNGNSSQIRAGRDEVVADFRSLWGNEHDEVALRLALFAGLADLGWNKALDAVGHPDTAERARERADLDWWVAQARATLEQGLLED